MAQSVLRLLKKFKYPFALVVFLFAFQIGTNQVYAATYTWDGGGGDSNWNTADNWSSNIVPTATDVALFDGTCVSNCDATINVSITVDGITLASDYTGTVTQASGNTVTVDASDGFTIAGGTFVGGDSLISLTTSQGDFVQTGGTFTNSSGGLSIYTDLTLTGGTFNNSYDITITDINSSGATDSVVTCSGSLPGRLIIYKNDVSGTASDVEIASGCEVSLGADPTTRVAALTVNGTINAASGVWTYESSRLGSLVNSGTLNHSGTGWVFLGSSLTNNIGGVINYSGTSITIDESFTQNGTFDLTGKTVTFTNSQGSNQTTIACSGELGGTVVMNKQAQSGEAHATVDTGCSINLGADPVSLVESNFTNNGTIVIASGTWTHLAVEVRDLINNGTISHLGTGWDINNAGLENYGTINYLGSLVSIDRNFAQYGTFDLTGKTVEMSQTDGSDASVISCADTIGGVMLFTKTSSSGSSTITISAGCTVTMSTAADHTMEQTFINNGTINVTSGTWNISSVEGGAGITNNGTITHNGTGWNIDNADLINYGTITYAGTSMDIDDDLNQSGTFDLTGITVNFTNGSVGGRTTTITCSGELGGTVVFNKAGSSSNSTTTVGAGCSINLGASPSSLFQTALVNNGTMTITSGTWTIDRVDGFSFTNNGTITHNGNSWVLDMVDFINNGTVTYAGSDIYINYNYTHGTGTFDTTGKTFYFNGDLSTNDSILSCSGNIQGNVVIDKGHSSSNFTIGSDCTIEGNFTRTNGPINNPASPYVLTIYGDLSYSTTDQFGAANLTIKFGGSSNQTITQNNVPSLNATAFVVEKSDPNATVTLASDLELGSTLTITSGVFSQGSIYTLETGAVTVASGAMWSNIGTGDIVLSGDVSNAGSIILKSNNVGTCAEGVNDIAITSSVAATQRTWSGAGTFTIYNVSVTDQAGTITVYSSDLNNSTWVDEACGATTITISGTVYSDEGSTSMVGTQTVRIKINGLGDYSATLSSGAYSVADITIDSAGDVVTVYLDGASEKAVTITRAANTSSNITNLDLYQNTVIVRNEDAGPITNTNLDQYDSEDDADIQFTVATGGSGDDLTVLSGNTLLINTTATYTPGGSVTTPVFKQTAGTFTASTNNVDVNGDFTLSGGTHSASSNNTYISGDLLISAGTFTHNGGVVVIDGTGAQSIDVTDSSIGALTIDKSAQVATLASDLDIGSSAFNITTGTFSQGASYNITTGAITVGASGAWSNLGTGDVTLGGDVSNAGIITLNSNTGVQCVDGLDSIVITTTDIRSAARTWSGAGTFDIYNVEVSYQDGAITVYTSTISNSDWVNGTCGSTITVSGTIYSDAGVTVLASTPTVRVKVNGLGDYSAAANGSGVYSIADVTINSASDVVTAYLDGASEKAVAVTKAASTVADIAGLNLYQNHVILRHEDAGPVTNADIGQYDSTDDTDVMLTVSAETGLVVDPALTLLVWSGHTYAPETDVVAETLVIDGTLNLNLNDPEVTVNDLTIEGSLSASNTSDLIVSGDFTNNGTFTHNDGTVVFIGSSDSVISSGEGSDIVFYNFTSNNSAGKTIQFEAGEPTKFEGALILAGTQEGQLTINSTTSTQWELWVTGSISVSRLVIKNSGCYAGTESITANPTVLNGGNNDTSCWLFIVRGGGGGTSSTGGQGPGGEGAEGGGGAGGGTSSTGTQGPGGEGAEGGGGAGNGGNASP